MAAFNRILFVVNRTKNGADALTEKLTRLCAENGVSFDIESTFPLGKSRLEGCDLCMVIGGDGTLLGVVEATSLASVPVLGVNLGRLGFMAHFSCDDVLNSFKDILKGAFSVHSRDMICCTTSGENCLYALNDVVIRAANSRLTRLTVTANDELMNTYHADGIIFASPTGSTAYNLSAGGPIVHPSAKVLVVTPINPHTLSNRAIVLDHSYKLEVSLIQEHDSVRLSADGREFSESSKELPLTITIAKDRQFLLVEPHNWSHFFVLRNKLRWTGDALTSI